jgi:hypothetical protein
MNTHPKNNNENGSGLLSHPDHISASKRGSVYDQIAERIIALLEKGTVPRRKPWNAQPASSFQAGAAFAQSGATFARPQERVERGKQLFAGENACFPGWHIGCSRVEWVMK